ncbi:MAG: class I SAM-dependent methyltransferase [Lachnospiraceae bacterium]|nr:class I SAM-dependent methyltransferase [Lachnospiraceae bacterium]
MNKDFLLQTYGQCYGPEAGPWNLSVENKYLEYMFTKFFEENFNVTEYADICNIGIGAGYWDRYLSYKLVNGSLTSIDIDENSCQQFKVCLENENNPNKVNIICSDVMLVEGMDEQYDIVTMVGSARLESGLFETIIEKAFSFLKPGGSLYYQSVDKNEAKESVIALCEKNKMQIDNYLLDTTYGFKAQYWKITK